MRRKSTSSAMRVPLWLHCLLEPQGKFERDPRLERRFANDASVSGRPGWQPHMLGVGAGSGRLPEIIILSCMGGSHRFPDFVVDR